MAEKLAAMPIAKLKLLESALKNLSDVAKNSGPLNDMFKSMKEGSMMSKPFTIFLKLLGAASTKASIDSIRKLFKLLSDPATSGTIDVLAAAVGGWMGSIEFITTSLTTLTTQLGLTDEGLKQLQAAVTFILTLPYNFLNFSAAADTLKTALGLTEQKLKRAGWQFSKFLNTLQGKAEGYSSVADYVGQYDIGGTKESYEDLVRRLMEDYGR